MKRVNLRNDLELNGFCYKLDFILSDLIIFKTAWQSNNIFFRLLDDNVLKHIFEGNIQQKNDDIKRFRSSFNSNQHLLKVRLKGILIIENGYKY